MKKFLSVILALMMAVSVLTAAATAFAVESPTAGPATDTGITVEVNGADSRDVVYTVTDVDGNLVLTFTYTGDGTLVGWEHNLLTLGFAEGEDFTAVENADGSYTLTLSSRASIAAYEENEIVVNAIVEFPDGSTTTAKPDDSSTSPNTGVATSVIAGSIAVASAGFAVLSATKKKDAE